jgi:hypothetical protein
MKTVHTISNEEAILLLEKYYEGETSNAEEVMLRNFLAQKDLPERFNPDQALFGYFERKRQQPKNIIIPMIKWTSIAASLIGLIIATKGLIFHSNDHYAYINGEKYTDTELVKEQALKSLDILSASCDEVETSAKALQDEDLVSTQLQQLIQE